MQYPLANVSSHNFNFWTDFRAHFNPVVSLIFWFKKIISLSDLVAYVLFQIIGAIFGCLAANIIFGLPVVTISTHVRHDLSQFLSEILATFGLVLVIFRA